MRIPLSLLTVGLLGLAGGLGYALYDQHTTQNKVRLQLQQLDQLLTSANDDAAQVANGTLKGLQVQVIKNQSQPRDLALFTRAEAFAARADLLVRTLRTRREELLRATNNSLATNGLVLPNPDAATTVASLLAVGTPAHENLTQQLLDYDRDRQELSPRDTARLGALPFERMPVVIALARLTRLEGEVRATETATLQQLVPALGAKRLTGHVVAMATAASNTVAPGSTYRAKLYLAKVITDTRLDITCNGKPVPLGPDGQAIVRFIAPRRPGPATWLGTVRYHGNGRDTTFQISVPYRVVRR